LSGVLELIYPIGTDYFVISYDRTIEPYPPDPPRHARVSLAAVRWSEGGWAIDQNIGVAYSYEYGDEILVSPTGSRAFRCISQMDSRWYTWNCISWLGGEGLTAGDKGTPQYRWDISASGDVGIE